MLPSLFLGVCNAEGGGYSLPSGVILQGCNLAWILLLVVFGCKAGIISPVGILLEDWVWRGGKLLVVVFLLL